MKKTIAILTFCLLAVGFAGISAAGPCVTCEPDPGHINRGCEGQQSPCYPFDYEDFGMCSESYSSYCEYGGKGSIHRALFKITDCIIDGIFDSVVEGDVIDIGMEILVDKGNGIAVGDNGVYWAENINSPDGGQGVGVQTYPTQADACSDYSCTPENHFVGDFIYKTATGDTGSPSSGSVCYLDSVERVVRFDRDLNQTGAHGYTVTQDDANNNNSVWWIDIPMLRVDPESVEAGWKVYVKICLYQTLPTGGICGECEGCCCMVYIGELCCPEAAVYGYCIYQYFPPANSTYWGLSCMVITSLADTAGTATVTVYETDGDVGMVDVPLTAHQIYLTTADILVPSLIKMAGSGTLGDSMFSAKVIADVQIHGLVMFANPQTGVSMSYSPECYLYNP